MDPVSVGLLVALAGGAGGEIGRQGWEGLTRLVRRPFRRDGGDAGAGSEVGSGEAELERLAAEPGDEARAQALSTALAVRAALDGEFRAGLRAWQDALPPLPDDGAGTVTNIVSGGTQYGPVVQGRDFSDITFNTPPPPPASSD
ncbi:hypothetical protein O7599_23315 [Streptomyces sp. WMMC500]|uniref:hypothetical protein n=1 Tax=Streptomyces sp. WMMC500 TaxID=3015154 RepID=UPI00248C18FA|nr:hypothetical protein [Streptomyces sp. WMMC500]WBB64596.1 hypothetical protein O7599_23315 [Streptomyces sp. WMMC500]